MSNSKSASGGHGRNRHHYYERLYDEYEVAAEFDGRSGMGEKKREGYLPWEKFFMSVAFLSSQRSKDPKTQVGACIVNPHNKIVGIGHNALPSVCDEEEFKYWGNRDVDKCGFAKTKYAYVCHAAINAILNKNAENLSGCTLYLTLFPSHEDAKMIIQAGIHHVVYYEDKYHDRMFSIIARKLLTKARVWCRSYHDLHLAIRDPVETVQVFPWGRKCPKPIPRSNCKDEDYFMAMACLAAQRSKDPARQVGACIVDDAGKVVGIGYNGFPLRISDDDPSMSWGKDGTNPMKMKYPNVVHAEVNAIMHKTCIDLKDCTLYTTLFPCNECAKVIIQAGIKKICYLTGDQDEKVYIKATNELLKMAGYCCEDSSTRQLRKRKRSTPQSESQSKRQRPDNEGVCKQYVPSKSFKIEFPGKRRSTRRKKK